MSKSIIRDYLAGDTLAILADRYSYSIAGIAKILARNAVKRRRAGNPNLGKIAKKNWQGLSESERRERYWKFHQWQAISHQWRNNNDPYFEANSGDNAPEWKRIFDKF
jgi:hypothetical protein